MTHRERFLATIERREVDRPASWLGLPVPAALPGLFDYFRVSSVAELKVCIDDDLFPVELPYHSPVSDAIYMAFDFARDGELTDDKRTLNAPGFFENITDPARVDEFAWPDPSQYIDPVQCAQVVTQTPEGYAVLGVVWSAHFQDACAAFGMQNALMTMVTHPEMFQAVIDRITDFYLEANGIFYAATRGTLDAVLIGNDFGGQTCLMLAPEYIRRHVLSGTHKLVKQAQDHGLKVIHHSCGAVRDIIPDLIRIGVDAIHPIQALASGMDAGELRREFGDAVSFCGGVDAQELLVRGTPEEVAARVLELKELFPTGLIISPSHEAILPDIAPANVRALFDAVRN